jgi:hypothetical protein
MGSHGISYAPRKILQVSQLAHSGIKSGISLLGAEKIMQVEQTAQLEYRKTQSLRAFNRVSKLCCDCVVIALPRSTYDQSFGPQYFRLDPSIAAL